ncbi:OmpH family outer membrane protein [Winogradskyella maritima]|uniref:OmpH family outer membrane protein n=1 Tax=Winogradskyella maritima TaxID=1517766 RepID=A0ABV8ADR4_9FLAO|nr:OmpH family outer membrane protein [Winogradskyella maritima]
MKKIFKILALVLLVSSCQEPQKIGFIDNGEVIEKFQLKIDVEAKYKGIDDKFKKRIDSLSKDFQLETQAFQLESQKMSQKKAQQRYAELGQKRQILEQRVQMEQQSMTGAFNEEMDSVLVKMNKLVGDYGKANGYSFILGKNQAGSVIYGEEAKDITKEVIEAINKDLKKSE